MAQFPLLKLTRTGQEMTGMSQGGGKLTFVRVELGDGELKEGDSIETLTALKHGVMQLPLQGYQSEGNGKARLRFIVDNSALAAGFINREIGVFAKIENGAEQLYAYTNAGNYADWIPSKETPIDGDIVDLHIVIGNAPNVVIETSNGAYAAKIDIEEHNKAPDAHADIRTAIKNAGIAILQRSRTYQVGDTAYSKHLPSWARLECVRAGTTGAELPTRIEQMVQNGGGVILTDGTVVWIIDDLRDGTPVGAVRGSLYLPAGYVKANGATVQRADYPRLVALADRHNLWTDDVTANAGLFGRGDGAATMVLPNWTDRMVQLAGDGAGKSVAAGLPNIKSMQTRAEIQMPLVGSADPKKTYGKGGFMEVHPEDGYFSGGSGGSGNRINYGDVDFDASRVNQIYGASTTVQPPAIKLIPVIRY